MPKPTSLSDRHERFIHEYLIDQNASAAAQRAGYSAKTKGTQAAELMKDPRIRERITLELGELFSRLKVTAFELLSQQVAAVRFDPAKLFDATQQAIPLADLDTDTKSALTVAYKSRRGETELTVRQTPRHVALAALWKRYDQFQKLQDEVMQAAPEPEPAPEVKDVPLPILDIDRPNPSGLKRRLPEYAFPRPEAAPQVTPQEAMQNADAAMAEASAQIAPEPKQEDAPKGVAPQSQAPEPPPANAETSGSSESTVVPPHTYDFRKDPNWMWGGRRKPTPEPEINPLALQAMIDARAREQHEELMAKFPQIRPGAPAQKFPPGYNPPWARNNRQQYATGAGECSFDGYGEND